MFKINYIGKSDIGLRRSNNEDAFAVKPELAFAAVADGMGGSASGEVASSIFIDTAVDVLSKARNRSVQDTAESVQKVFQLSNGKIFKTAEENTSHHGMGCTAEVLAFFDQSYVVGHVGDSRTYLLREGQLRQITRDHSVVQDQLDQGLITKANARNHSLRNIILRAVGVREPLDVDIIRGEIRSGDIFLLCSDGLTDRVEDALIMEVLLLSVDLDHKADHLIDLAKSAGGQDNITVTLCEVV
ncbi:MAG: Stp1/IreP family PP2C-type Ser/Thr phosphatase [Nitrospirae bacterium]|nr:Stp1/IreP family PP2C-type Ser/Thr phosphatase [Nitrospirota bacterium]